MTSCITSTQYTHALQSWLLNLHYSAEQDFVNDHEPVQLPLLPLDGSPPSMSLSLQTLPGGDYVKVPRRIVAIEIRQGTSQISRKINFSI